MSDGGDDPHDDGMLRAHSISPVNWDVANILNSASRVSVPLFFMISGFLFLASVAHNRDILFVSPRVSAFIAPSR